jgi:rhamnogalacturonan endolyase
VDGDGFDEIVYGSMTVDHDGLGLYSTGLRHGDALHMTDIDPNRPGLEVFMVDEQTSENGGIASHYQDAKDGTIIWEDKATGDNGRGCAGPLMAGTTGWQMWSGSGGLFNAAHTVVGSKPGSTNFTIWWGAELNRFLEDGTSITPYGSGGGTGLSASGCSSNNGSKSDACPHRGHLWRLARGSGLQDLWQQCAAHLYDHYGDYPSSLHADA